MIQRGVASNNLVLMLAFFCAGCGASQETRCKRVLDKHATELAELQDLGEKMMKFHRAGVEAVAHGGFDIARVHVAGRTAAQDVLLEKRNALGEKLREEFKAEGVGVDDATQYWRKYWVEKKLDDMPNWIPTKKKESKP